MQPKISEFVSGRRSQLVVLGVVAVLALIAANIAWLSPTLNELENNAFVLHKTISLDVRNQLLAFLNKQENELLNAADIINQKTFDENSVISLLIKENGPFESVSIIDVKGKEVLKNHKFFLAAAEDLRDLSADELFSEILSGKIYRSKVAISKLSEPIMVVAVPLAPRTGFSAIVAEINLKFLLEVVRGVKVSDGGVVYIVDQDGFIIAHPNTSLVFGRRNIFPRKIVELAISGKEVDTRSEELSYEDDAGNEVFAVLLPFEPTNWAIAVESPRNLALVSSQRIVSVAVISFMLEIALLALLVWNYINLVKTAFLFYNEKNQREAILNSLYDGVLEYNERSVVVLMNPKAEEILGTKFKDIDGLVILPDILNKKPELKSLVEVMYPALAPYTSSVKELTGTRAKTMELHTSTDLKLRVTITNVLDQTGDIKGFLKILHDVSREQLISRIKSEFVSIAAHQLRTPLSAIKWTLKLLLDGDAGELTASQLEFLQKGYAINERMIKLVSDLLNAARIEEGRFGYEFKEIDLGRFLSNTADNYKPLALSKYVNLVFGNNAGDLQPIFGDPEKLALAINNLLDNAIKYTPSGGTITFKLDKKDNDAVITISDSGVGIPAAEQKRAFSKFFRASNVMRMETEGTGLGLFIVRNVVRRHGGKITFSSRENQGTTFIITLPLEKGLIPKEEIAPLEEFLENV